MDWSHLLSWLSAAGVVGTFFWRVMSAVNKLRLNDVHHLNEKLDVQHAETIAAVEKVSDRLDKHIEWHMNQK